MRPHVGITLAAIVLALTVGFGIANSQVGPPNGESPQWPLRITYSVTQFDSGRETHAEYALEAVDWTAWRQVTTCCDDTTGLVLELRPDSSVWAGGLPGLPIDKGFVHKDGDGMVPLPDLAPRFPTSATELMANSMITVLYDSESGVSEADLQATAIQKADEIGLSATDLVAYRIDRQIKADGSSKEGTDFRLVYRPLNLVIRNEELVDGDILRVFEIHSIEGLSPEFVPPFGAPSS